ncbi:MAG: WYL domain-containing protein [Clostridia bacterium]|nr:WYL domain-containing protein [Clostridia bacterium]
MLFHEIYGIYYRTVEKILSMAVAGELTEELLRKTAGETAYSESALTILPALKTGKWQLLHPDLTTPLERTPEMPVTELEKRWLKSILTDLRVTLFDLPEVDLSDVEPFFTPEDWVVFDQYSDGDPYDDPLYRKRFRIVLDAVHQKQPLQVSMVNRFGKPVRWYVMPERLEYSEKDDKFRLYTSGCPHCSVLNLAKLTYAAPCSIDRIREDVGEEPKEPCRIVMELTDRRNALERVMLHFAHFRKTAQKLKDDRYTLTVEYDPDDETELVIRVLSFGPFLKVTEPESFVERIRERLRMQQKYGL